MPLPWLSLVMKRTVKIAFCGLMAAFATVLMLLSFFPYFTYAVPAVAGAVTLFVLVECGAKWSIATYAVSAILIFIFAEPEAMLMYVLLLGYYPILKAYIEKVKPIAVQYLLKLVVFNGAIALIYGVFASIYKISLAEFGNFGKYSIIVFAVVGNITFFLYDVVLVRVADFYINRIHGTISKLLKHK